MQAVQAFLAKTHVVGSELTKKVVSPPMDTKTDLIHRESVPPYAATTDTSFRVTSTSGSSSECLHENKAVSSFRNTKRSLSLNAVDTADDVQKRPSSTDADRRHETTINQQSVVTSMTTRLPTAISP